MKERESLLGSGSASNSEPVRDGSIGNDSNVKGYRMQERCGYTGPGHDMNENV